MTGRSVRARFAGSCVAVAIAVASCHRGTARIVHGVPVFTEDLPHRVMVEVLNAGGPPGAARAGTLLLRRARLDVVAFGNAPAALARRGRNEVLVRRGDTTGVGRVIAMLGSADVVEALDSTSMVDLTVLLGRQFVPPADTPP